MEGSGSRRLKNIRILQILIRNPATVFNTILELVYGLMILLESTVDEMLLKITKSKFLLCAFTFRVKSNGFN
jgi:hypothetical protein